MTGGSIYSNGIERMVSSYESRRKIRLCHVVRHAKIAGTEKHVHLLATGIDQSRFEVHVCTFEHGELVRRLQDKGIGVTVIPKSHSVIHFIRLVRFFFTKRYDLVHCHSGGYACVAARMAGIARVLYTKHGIGFTSEELQNRSPSRKMRDRIVDLCVARYITLTRYDNDMLGIARGRIVVIHNGIDPDFGLTANPVRARAQMLVGTVGRLTRQKGIEFLIQAMPMIIERYRNAKLLIAGSGEEDSRLKDLVKRLGLEKKVEFLGYVDNPAAVIKSINVFVLPSLWEGFPYVLLEAMILKRPIVATDIFGVNEIIKQQISGILVQPRDPDNMAKAVVSLMSNSLMSRKMGEAAYRQVLSDFTLNKSISKTVKLYDSLFVATTKSQ
jgi:glycosyltransferase involved in cell wall biosynthesis